MIIYSRKVMEYDYQDILEYTLDNESGLRISILNLGATITKLETKDSKGMWGNIILSYANIEDYIENESYYGATIGRTSGRIYNGKITINNKTYNLNKNYGTNQGHGGANGISKKLWQVSELKSESEIGLEFKYLSKDGEEGYPGNVEIKVTYTVNKENELKVTVHGLSDKDTLLNITNHSYFNLSGNYKSNVLKHSLQMNCDRLLEIDETGATTGKIQDCTSGVFSFNISKEIGRDIDKDHEQLKLGYGYDHPFLFKDKEEGKIILLDKVSGRAMKVKTNHKGVVIYTQNFIDNKKLVGSIEVEKRMGICLEVQSPPIGYNEAFKEMSLLKANKNYFRETIYSFTAE